MNQFTHMFTSITNSIPMIGEIIGLFLGGICVGILGTWKRKRFNLKQLFIKDQKFVQNHTQLHEVLTELRLICSCSRSLIFQFHNGGSFSDGSSMKRFSVTHESIGIGVQSMILEAQDVLLTRYMELVRVLDTKPHKIIRTETLPDSSFRAGLEINNVLCFSMSPLKCSDGLVPMGFVCCHWCDEEDFENGSADGLTKSFIEDAIEDTAHTINTHLTYTAGHQ